MRLLLILISLLFFSCGTRRTELEASKTKVSASIAKTSDIEIKNDVTNKVATSAAEYVKESEKDIELIEEFHENGHLKKRTYRESSKQKDNATKKDSVASTIDKSTAEIKQSEKSTYDSLSKAKDKKTSADKTVAKNVGGAGWLYGIIISIVIILLIYFWLRKPVKKEKKE